MPDSRANPPKDAKRLEGAFWAKRPGILEHYASMTPDEIMVFDVLGLDVVTRPWFRPHDPATHFTTLTIRDIEEILPRSRGSVGGGIKALKERGWVTARGKRLYIKKFVRFAEKPARILDKPQGEQRPTPQQDAEILALILDTGDGEDGAAYILDKLARILDKAPPGLARILDTVRKLLEDLHEKKNKPSEIYEGLNMTEGDMAKVLSEADLLFTVRDFFHLVAERLGVIDDEGKPFPRALPTADKGRLFRAWADNGPFARRVVDEALASTLNEQKKKGKKLPIAYHLKAIANLQAVDGHKHPMVAEDKKGKGMVRRLAEGIMGRGRT